MCLAQPLKLMQITDDGASGVVGVSGGELTVGLDLTPEARIGDFVLVHAGMAIEVLTPEDAASILDAVTQYATTDAPLPPESSRS